MIRNNVDIDKVIEEDIGIEMSIFDKDFTKTSLFILQMLGYKYITMPPYFVNAFIGDADHEASVEHPIFILCKIDIALAHRDHTWITFEKKLQNNPCFLYKYYVGIDKNTGFDLVMYVFDIPELYKEDYLHFLEGKYSKFTKEYKAIFPRLTVIGGKSEPSIHFKAIEKDPDLKLQIEKILDTYLDEEAELWPKPDLKREIFRI